MLNEVKDNLFKQLQTALDDRDTVKFLHFLHVYITQILSYAHVANKTRMNEVRIHNILNNRSEFTLTELEGILWACGFELVITEKKTLMNILNLWGN